MAVPGNIILSKVPSSEILWNETTHANHNGLFNVAHMIWSIWYGPYGQYDMQ